MSSKIGLLIKEDLWVSSKLFHYRITWKLAVQEIDLLIIGSGPAGLSTALHLLQKDAGWAERMIVVEKAIHLRPKVCAGGVTRIGLKALRDLDFQIPLPIPVAEIEDARLQYKKRVIHVRGQPAIVIYNRIEFDANLAQEARHLAFMHTLWAVGQLAAALWSPTIPKYAASSQVSGRKSKDLKRHYAD